MKIVFTADTHFDSAFAGGESAQLVYNFDGIADYAQSIGAAGVLIGGDMFDSPYPSPETEAAVRRVFKKHENLGFYAICGNHDPWGMCAFYSDPPENLFVFPAEPTAVSVGDIEVYGYSLTDVSEPRPQPFSAPRRSITLTHGDFDAHALALTGAALHLMGHIHKSESFKLPDGSRALYAGIPAGRGFDECGKKCFYVIDTQTLEFTPVYTNAAVFNEYDMDVSGVETASGLLEILQSIELSPGEKARAILRGKRKAPLNIDLAKLCEHTDFVAVRDKTEIDIDLKAAQNEKTLEGEFVRIMTKELESAQDKQPVLDALREGIIAIRSGK